MILYHFEIIWQPKSITNYIVFSDDNVNGNGWQNSSIFYQSNLNQLLFHKNKNQRFQISLNVSKCTRLEKTNTNINFIVVDHYLGLVCWFDIWHVDYFQRWKCLVLHSFTYFTVTVSTFDRHTSQQVANNCRSSSSSSIIVDSYLFFGCWWGTIVDIKQTKFLSVKLSLTAMMSLKTKHSTQKTGKFIIQNLSFLTE